MDNNSERDAHLKKRWYAMLSAWAYYDAELRRYHELTDTLTEEYGRLVDRDYDAHRSVVAQRSCLVAAFEEVRTALHDAMPQGATMQSCTTSWQDKFVDDLCNGRLSHWAPPVPPAVRDSMYEEPIETRSRVDMPTDLDAQRSAWDAIERWLHVQRHVKVEHMPCAAAFEIPAIRIENVTPAQATAIAALLKQLEELNTGVPR